ncbi:MAG: DUF2924 domain-containing protein [Planctomycetes bacterium]|nr:DUF2924 domain-containing protein [Planctomycetota bacterium]
MTKQSRKTGKPPDITRLQCELRDMTVPELRRRYAEVFGEGTTSRHKPFLIRRILWRVQANAEGGLPERARQRALEIADDADLRVQAPASGSSVALAMTANGKNTHTSTRHLSAPVVDERLPTPGAVLTRRYRGRTVQVRVLPHGFDYDGTIYRSLSAVARAVTGSHWNGYLFFGLATPKDNGKEAGT